MDKYKELYDAVSNALDEPTVDYCNSCSCRVPCGDNEREIVSRIRKIIENFD